MPEKMTKMDGGYQVKGPHGVHMKKGSKKNAEAQMRLLNAVEHGWTPTGKKSGRSDQGGHMGMGSPPCDEKFSNPDKY